MSRKISYVKERTVDGTPYGYFVKYTNGTTADYCNTDKNGRTTGDYYSKAKLPKGVQKHINSRTGTDFSSNLDKKNMKTYGVKLYK